MGSAGAQTPAEDQIHPPSWKGITLTGALDFSVQYESKGSPYRGDLFTSAGIIGPANRSPQWVFAPNQDTQSFIGLRAHEAITEDLAFTGRVEFGFDPTRPDVTDALKSLQRENGVPPAEQATSGDGTRAGQILNGEAWAGIASRSLGEVRIGRNDTVAVDMAGAYDPMLSYGFSLSGYVVLLVGQGSAETPRLDKSVKVIHEQGPIHIETIFGHPQTDVDDFTQASVGWRSRHFWIDVIGGRATDLVSASALAGVQNRGSAYLGARVFDTALYGAFLKYVVERNEVGQQHGLGLTLSGGYQRLVFSNPSGGGLDVGHETIGGYVLGPVMSTNASATQGIVNYAYTGGNRDVNISFLAVKLQISRRFSVGTGYYRFDQGSFGFGVPRLPGISAPSYSASRCADSSHFNCSGSEVVTSLRLEYVLTPRLTAYLGGAYSQVGGGFAFGYLATSTWDPTLGLKMSF